VSSGNTETVLQALSPAKLHAAPLLLRERGSGTRDVLEQALKSAGLDVAALQVVMSLDSTEASKSAVEAGLGVRLISRWALRETNMGALAVVRLSTLRIRRTFDFAYPQGRRRQAWSACLFSSRRSSEPDSPHHLRLPRGLAWRRADFNSAARSYVSTVTVVTPAG